MTSQVKREIAPTVCVNHRAILEEQIDRDLYSEIHVPALLLFPIDGSADSSSSDVVKPLQIRSDSLQIRSPSSRQATPDLSSLSPSRSGRRSCIRSFPGRANPRTSSASSSDLVNSHSSSFE
ncbi:hypothetical protein OROGR_020024 [Orobanche gracilis]